MARTPAEDPRRGSDLYPGQPRVLTSAHYPGIDRTPPEWQQAVATSRRAEGFDAAETRVRTVVAPTGFEPVFQP